MRFLVEVRQIQEVRHGQQPDDHRFNVSKNGAQINLSKDVGADIPKVYADPDLVLLSNHIVKCI